MDGLLIDSEPLWKLAIDAFCAKRGATYTNEDAAACIGRGIAHTVERLTSRCGWAPDHAAHVAEIARDFALRVPHAPAHKGAEALLRTLAAKFPTALASSSERWLVEAALADRGWLARFAAIVTGSDVTRLKPAPDIFLLAAERLGVEPGACVVFEDSLAGCTAARAAGMFVVAVPELAHAVGASATDSRAVDVKPFAAFDGIADIIVNDLDEASHALCL